MPQSLQQGKQSDRVNTELDATFIKNTCKCLGETYNHDDEAEYALYYVSDLSNSHGSLLALLRETREYDPATDTKTVNTTIHDMGTITVSFKQSPFVENETKYEQGPVSMMTKRNLGIIKHDNKEYMLEQVERVINKQLDDHVFKQLKIDNVSETGFDFGFSLHKYTRMAWQNGRFDGGSSSLEQLDIDRQEFMRELTGNNDVDGPTNWLSLSLEYSLNSEPWMIRAAEHQHLGLFKNKPATACVKAVREQEPHLTQQNIADRFNVNPSTVSRQVDTIEDLEQRAEWAMNQ